ncbi:MAG: hypothetical protein F6K36_24825 [Symploca sp. SIO3C6]|uniref:Uncharacterized protein n=1 Tax=Symploca sp. SIO1C4 TaxID=2607765 RepID=A0A6B3N9W0_9CYAN|nr:hypothetical protein [Symploca sp. SIO3C6]NER28390.1 hypothetical protein [Symploca sp. SIO1C4]NET04739.1 hypothetical protein [Symploca sp. SIO2B6]NET49284.1 hypothetical protein [Merismopedia sp. SIO2A8]
MYTSERLKSNLHIAAFTNASAANSEDVHIGVDDINYYYRPARNLAEAAITIHQLLEKLEQTHPNTTKAQKQIIAAEVIEQEIKSNLILKARLRAAFEAAGIKALKAIFNHPHAQIPVETLKVWIEVE